MAEWLVEEGIGEDRAILLKDGEIIAARLHWPGALTIGQVEDVVVEKVTRTGAWRKYGLVRFANGQQAHASRMPRETTEGMRVRQKVNREAISERGGLKLARSNDTTDEPTPAPSLGQQLRNKGESVKIVRQFPPEADWDELFMEAWTGDVAFNGGALIVSDTPAMTLIDVDADGYLEAIHHNGIPAIARTIHRLNIGGNIGVDFPTADKTERKGWDKRLEQVLADWPHERTTANGFGFVQIVAALGQPSMLQRIARNRSGAAARLLLRRAERVSDPGTIELSAHPAVLTAMEAPWLEELSRRTGRQLRTRSDPSLALEGGFAQAVQP